MTDYITRFGLLTDVNNGNIEVTVELVKLEGYKPQAIDAPGLRERLIRTSLADPNGQGAGRSGGVLS